LVESVDISANTFELDAHGFVNDTVVQFRAAGGGTLPTGVSEATDYYAIKVSDWRFQVSSAAGGGAIDLTAAGTTFAVLSPLPVASVLSKAARMIDDMLPSHAVPVASPYPDILVMTNAELAAAELLALTGGQSDSLTEVYDRARKRVERWAKNAPIRGDSAPATAQRSVTGTGSRRTSWMRYGGIY
jgi:hypothetical protein